jgi:lysine biosynthesis protein LysW
MGVRNERHRVVTACPDCGQRIALNRTPKLGQRLVCTHCGTELKVVKAQPLELAKAFTV